MSSSYDFQRTHGFWNRNCLAEVICIIKCVSPKIFRPYVNSFLVPKYTDGSWQTTPLTQGVAIVVRPTKIKGWQKKHNFLLVYLIAPSPQGDSSGTDIIQCTGCGNREYRLKNFNTHGELYCLIHFNCYVPDSITAVHISTRCCYRIQVFPIFRVRCL